MMSVLKNKPDLIVFRIVRLHRSGYQINGGIIPIKLPNSMRIKEPLLSIASEVKKSFSYSLNLDVVGGSYVWGEKGKYMHPMLQRKEIETYQAKKGKVKIFINLIAPSSQSDATYGAGVLYGKYPAESAQIIFDKLKAARIRTPHDEARIGEIKLKLKAIVAPLDARRDIMYALREYDSGRITLKHALESVWETLSRMHNCRKSREVHKQRFQAIRALFEEYDASRILTGKFDRPERRPDRKDFDNELYHTVSWVVRKDIHRILDSYDAGRTDLKESLAQMKEILSKEPKYADAQVLESTYRNLERYFKRYDNAVFSYMANVPGFSIIVGYNTPVNMPILCDPGNQIIIAHEISEGIRAVL